MRAKTRTDGTASDRARGDLTPENLEANQRSTQRRERLPVSASAKIPSSAIELETVPRLCNVAEGKRLRHGIQQSIADPQVAER